MTTSSTQTKSELFADLLKTDNKINELGPAFRLLVHLLFVHPLDKPTNYRDLAQTLGKDKKTIEKWVSTLEQLGCATHKRTGNSVKISLTDRYLTIATSSDRIIEKGVECPYLNEPRFQTLLKYYEGSKLSDSRLAITAVC
jgi:hypothetical protein